MVSCQLPRDLVEQLDSINGDNRSEAIRTLLCLGAELAADPTFGARLQLSNLVDRIDAVLTALPGTRTPSGARWSATPEGLPDPSTLAAPCVVACPVGVLVVGLGGVLLIDSEAGSLLVVADNGQEHCQPLELPQLARLAAELPAALVAVATGGPGSGVQCLNSGLKLCRPGNGHLRLELGDVALSVSANDGWRLAAEVTALLARRLDLRVGQALAAEAALAAPAAAPADQEVAR